MSADREDREFDTDEVLIPVADLQDVLDQITSLSQSLAHLHAKVSLLSGDLVPLEVEEDAEEEPWDPAWKQAVLNTLDSGPLPWRRVAKVLRYCDANDGFISRDTTCTILGLRPDHQFKRFCAPALTVTQRLVTNGVIPADTVKVPLAAVYGRGPLAIGFRSNW